MRRTLIIAVLVLAALALVAGLRCRPAPPAATCEVVTQAPFSVTSTYEGEIESRHLELVMSRLSGAATITEIVPDCSTVKKGDVLARFGTSAIEQELIRLQREFTLAECDLENLEKAKLPIELSDIEGELLEARTVHAMEKRFLDKTADLVKENLISREEMENQGQKVERLALRVRALEHKLELIRDHTHPSTLKRARASLATAEQALALAHGQYSNCTIRAPVDGVVVYKPVSVGTEYRTARVGDSVYENQPFMMIPNLHDLVVRFNVPETEYSKVQPGNAASVVPLAHPDLRISGAIEAVTSMAQPIVGAPTWQKYFRAVAALTQDDPRLRPGMSAYVHVVALRKDNAVLVPRAAVFWRADVPACKVVTTPGRFETRDITLGQGNATHYEVLAGLKPGEKVAVE